MKKLILIIAILGSFQQLLNAQRKAKPSKTKPAVTQQKPADRTEEFGDSTKPKNVVITSVFKPSLRASSKINFSAASPAPDIERPALEYNVPAQNLFFAYQPAVLKPLAAYIDTSIHWNNSNFIKAGFGNYTTPFVQAGFSLGDGKKQVINVHAKHVSSSGNNLSEKYSKTNAEVIGIFNPNDVIEWTGTAFFDNNSQYQYGFQPDTLKLTKDDLLQRFTTFGIKAGLRNKKENEYGISYNPDVAIDLFSENRTGKESNFVLNAPLSKSFGKILAFNLGLTANFTNYTSDSSGSINNNLYLLTPAVQFKTPNVKLVAGITPSWDNSVFNMLPNFTADIKVQDEKIILQAGWVGYYHKTTYQSLAGINPWLQQPKFLLNTRIKELYAGFKGSAGSHLTYNARVSYLQFSNQPLFVNDTVTGKSFGIVNESSLKDIRIHGEIGYTIRENFSLLAGASFNQYSNLKNNARAWGLLPLEINGALRWQLMKDVLIKSDVYFWDGAQYRNKSLDNQKLKPAFDLNAGIEFAVLPRFNIWLQMNNVFNNRYQRWNQYEVLGFNVLAGFVYSFGQTGK